MDELHIHAVIAAIRVRFGLKSQPEIARYLRVTEKTLSNWLHGRNYPDTRYVQLLAGLSGVDQEAFAAYIEAQRAPTDAGREMWLRAARRLRFAANSAVPFAIDSVALECIGV